MRQGIRCNILRPCIQRTPRTHFFFKGRKNGRIMSVPALHSVLQPNITEFYGITLTYVHDVGVAARQRNSQLATLDS